MECRVKKRNKKYSRGGEREIKTKEERTKTEQVRGRLNRAGGQGQGDTKNRAGRLHHGHTGHPDPPQSPAHPVPVKGTGPYLAQNLSSKEGAEEHLWPFTFTTKVSSGRKDQGQHCSKQTLKVQFPHFRALLKGTTASP